VEEKAIERIENAVKERGFRFRPSALIPLVQCSNAVVGKSSFTAVNKHYGALC
jgi:hypothetical protein